MTKKELLHMVTDLLLEIREQGDYVRLDMCYGTIEVSVMEGKFDPEKDYLVSERFELARIEGSSRFIRMLDYLSELASRPERGTCEDGI